MKIKDAIYGTFEIEEIFGKLINSPMIQRLKGIHQNGADFLVDPRRSASRYDHSIGVMLLIRKLGGKIEEQIAGLLHDVSHTVFSHTIDLAMGYKNQDYHESVKESHLDKSDIIKILKDEGFDPKILFNEKNFPILEKDLPDLCADRLDYMFRDLYNIRSLTLEEISQIIEGLVVDKNMIKCRDIETARKIFKKFIELNEKVFFTQKAEVANILLSYILKKMIASNQIAECDLFTYDKVIIEKIKRSEFAHILEMITPEIQCEISKEETILVKDRKLRVVDPIIGDKRLSELDSTARKDLSEFKKTRITIYYKVLGLELD